MPKAAKDWMLNRSWLCEPVPAGGWHVLFRLEAAGSTQSPTQVGSAGSYGVCPALELEEKLHIAPLRILSFDIESSSRGFERFSSFFGRGSWVTNKLMWADSGFIGTSWVLWGATILRGRLGVWSQAGQVALRGDVAQQLRASQKPRAVLWSRLQSTWRQVCWNHCRECGVFLLMLCFGFYRLLSLIRCTAVNARHALISLQTLVRSVYKCKYKFNIKCIHCMLSSHWLTEATESSVESFCCLVCFWGRAHEAISCSVDAAIM